MCIFHIKLHIAHELVVNQVDCYMSHRACRILSMYNLFVAEFPKITFGVIELSHCCKETKIKGDIFVQI